MLIPPGIGKRSRRLVFAGTALCFLAQGPMAAAGTSGHFIGSPEQQARPKDLAEFRTPPFSLAPNLSPDQRMGETFFPLRKLLPVFPVLGAPCPLCSLEDRGLVRDGTAGPHKLDRFFLRQFKDDFVDCFLAPAGWNQRDLFSLSVVLGGGFVLLTTDEDVQDWVQEQRTSASDKVSRTVGPLGGGAVLGSLIFSLYLSGELFHQDSLRRTALQGLESWMISGVMVAGLKFLTGRARPTTGAPASTFKPFSGSSRYYSLPSGHASSAFAVASVIASNSDRLWVDLLSFTLAALVAVSRVHDNEHWPSDVFFGSALGYFVGRRISSAEKRTVAGFRLTFLSDRSGLALSWVVSL